MSDEELEPLGDLMDEGGEGGDVVMRSGEERDQSSLDGARQAGSRSAHDPYESARCWNIVVSAVQVRESLETVIAAYEQLQGDRLEEQFKDGQGAAVVSYLADADQAHQEACGLIQALEEEIELQTGMRVAEALQGDQRRKCTEALAHVLGGWVQDRAHGDLTSIYQPTTPAHLTQRIQALIEIEEEISAIRSSLMTAITALTAIFDGSPPPDPSALKPPPRCSAELEKLLGSVSQLVQRGTWGEEVTVARLQSELGQAKRENNELGLRMHMFLANLKNREKEIGVLKSELALARGIKTEPGVGGEGGTGEAKREIEMLKNEKEKLEKEVEKMKKEREMERREVARMKVELDEEKAVGQKRCGDLQKWQVERLKRETEIKVEMDKLKEERDKLQKEVDRLKQFESVTEELRKEAEKNLAERDRLSKEVERLKKEKMEEGAELRRKLLTIEGERDVLNGELSKLIEEIKRLERERDREKDRGRERERGRSREKSRERSRERGTDSVLMESRIADLEQSVEKGKLEVQALEDEVGFLRKERNRAVEEKRRAEDDATRQQDELMRLKRELLAAKIDAEKQKTEAKRQAKEIEKLQRELASPSPVAGGVGGTDGQGGKAGVGVSTESAEVRTLKLQVRVLKAQLDSHSAVTHTTTSAPATPAHAAGHTHNATSPSFPDRQRLEGEVQDLRDQVKRLNESVRRLERALNAREKEAALFCDYLDDADRKIAELQRELGKAVPAAMEQ